MRHWIDTHSHIYLSEFDKDRNEVIERSLQAGVKCMVMPNIDHTTVDALLETELSNPDICFPMMGLHPCSVKKDFERELYQVEDWLRKRKFLAVGEIGTDLYWDKTFWHQQVEAFAIQVEWAKKYKLPIVIHCRESLDQTIDVLKPMAGAGLKGIFHCFTGTLEQAREIIDMGFFLGIGGVVTFKNGGLDKVVNELELDNMVLETDSPYLAPVPYRGKRNEPSFIPLIGRKVVELLACTEEEVQVATTGNARSLFQLGA